MEFIEPHRNDVIESIVEFWLTLYNNKLVQHKADGPVIRRVSI